MSTGTEYIIYILIYVHFSRGFFYKSYHKLIMQDMLLCVIHVTAIYTLKIRAQCQMHAYYNRAPSTSINHYAY